MGNDLPDYQSQVIGVGLEATSFRSGLDTDKSASPAAGDIWLARDTFYLYVCNVAGSWDKVAKLYLLLAGGTMSGDIAMGTNKITGLGDPASAQDAATRAYVLAQIQDWLLKTGGTMSGALTIAFANAYFLLQNSGGKVAYFQTHDNNNLYLFARTATQGDVIALQVPIGSDDPPLNLFRPTLLTALNANSQLINNLLAPVSDNDAARKVDVDTVNAKLDDVTWSEPTRVKDTNYQNTTGKLKFVAITVVLNNGDVAELRLASSSPPGTNVVSLLYSGTQPDYMYLQGCLIVPINYYYRLNTTAGTIEVSEWHEWDLL